MNRSGGSRTWPSAETTRSACRHRDLALRASALTCADERTGRYNAGRDDVTLPARRGSPWPKRWTQRPAGSTWGDWGDDDELGRINLLTPEKVLEGVREVEAGISFCLSLPLDYPGRHRAEPAAPPAAPRADRGHGRHAGRLLQRPHERDARTGATRQLRRRVGRRRGDALPAVLDAVGLARPRRCRVRRRRRRRRGGRLLQRLPRRGRPRRARSDDAARRRRAARVLRTPPGPRAHGVPRECRVAACSSTWPTTSATSGEG